MEEQSVSTTVKLRPLTKALKVVSNLLFGFTMLLCLLFAFSLVQMKLSGGPPNVAGYHLYIVLSGSMNPTFDTGSLAIVKPTNPEEIIKGDIITYRGLSGRKDLVSHRVVEIHKSDDGITYTTKGNANDVADPNPIPASRLVGKVVLTIPYLGYVLDYAQTRQGLITLIFIPALILIIFEAINLYKYLQASEKEKIVPDQSRQDIDL